MKLGPSDELPGNDSNVKTPDPLTPGPASTQQQSDSGVCVHINLSQELSDYFAFSFFLPSVLFFNLTPGEEAEFTALKGLTAEGITGAVNYTQCEIATPRQHAICLAWQSELNTTTNA